MNHEPKKFLDLASFGSIGTPVDPKVVEAMRLPVPTLVIESARPLTDEDRARGFSWEIVARIKHEPVVLVSRETPELVDLEKAITDYLNNKGR